MIVIQLHECTFNCTIFFNTDNGTAEHYTELGEFEKSYTYDKIISYAN